MKYVIMYLVIMCFTVTLTNAQQCKEADAELNKIYKLIISKYQADTLFIQKLKKVQLAWIKYRDAHIESHFPLLKNEQGEEKYGSVISQCECYDLERLTRERVELLQLWLNGAEEGDVCHGSIKLR